MPSLAAAYAEAIDTASLLAIREFDALFDSLDTDDPVACKAVLLDAVPLIVAKYGGIAAKAAAEYYEAERSAVLEGGFEAFLAEPVDAEAIRAKVRYCLRYLFGGGER